MQCVVMVKVVYGECCYDSVTGVIFSTCGILRLFQSIPSFEYIQHYLLYRFSLPFHCFFAFALFRNLSLFSLFFFCVLPISKNFSDEKVFKYSFIRAISLVLFTEKLVIYLRVELLRLGRGSLASLPLHPLQL